METKPTLVENLLIALGKCFCPPKASPNLVPPIAVRIGRNNPVLWGALLSHVDGL